MKAHYELVKEATELVDDFIKKLEKAKESIKNDRYGTKELQDFIDGFKDL